MFLSGSLSTICSSLLLLSCLCTVCLFTRLVESMYKCQLQCHVDALGGLYSVINQRRGKVLDEDMREGTNSFFINFFLPVVESFGFSNDVKRKTGGSACPQLVFDHWSTMEQDPFWIPRTEDELEEFGSSADNQPNLVHDLMEKIRKRKGLKTEQKVVVHGEKQRTRARKK